MNKTTSAANTMLVVDDDVSFCTTLARAMQRRQYNVVTAHDEASALQAANDHNPAYAVVDLRLGQSSGLSVVQQLVQRDKSIRIVVLTGYASIATAVEAIKLGAVHYLTKPADPDEIMLAFEGEQAGGNPEVEVASEPMSVRRLEWEHIQRVLQQHNGNISAAARTLKMHRRSLQRKLLKRPARE
ncbi:MAG: response regulator [Gammaproteobacteria bacterium]|nr:response regulator [Gammaproteobacteria bacterium]